MSEQKKKRKRVIKFTGLGGSKFRLEIEAEEAGHDHIWVVSPTKERLGHLQMTDLSMVFVQCKIGPGFYYSFSRGTVQSN